MNRITRRGTLRRLLLSAACLPLVDVWGGGIALGGGSLPRSHVGLPFDRIGVDQTGES